MREITHKTHVIITRGTGRHYISAQSAEQIVALVNSHTPAPLIKVGEQHIATRDIQGVVTAAFLEEMDHSRAGDYQCKHGTWHKRGDSCQCYLVKPNGAGLPKPKPNLPPIVGGSRG